MYFCGNHLSIYIFLGRFSIDPFSHFHNTNCGIFLNELINTLISRSGRFDVFMLDPKLKYITPSTALSRIFFNF